MSTLPPLLQVMGNTVTPGRRAVSGSGARATSRGFPSASTRFASRTTVGWVQLPPRKPWNAPEAVISAMSPACDELAGWRRTTTASTNGSSRWASSAAIWRRSDRMTRQRYARTAVGSSGGPKEGLTADSQSGILFSWRMSFMRADTT